MRHSICKGLQTDTDGKFVENDTVSDKCWEYNGEHRSHAHSSRQFTSELRRYHSPRCVPVVSGGLGGVAEVVSLVLLTVDSPPPSHSASALGPNLNYACGGGALGSQSFKTYSP
jgi:hypothetical protein